MPKNVPTGGTPKSNRSTQAPSSRSDRTAARRTPVGGAHHATTAPRSAAKWMVIGGAVLIVAVLAFGIFQQSQTQTTSAATVDGISCQSMEQAVTHIHQYIALFDHGTHIMLPPGIGILPTAGPQGCLYWLHVHYTDNILHDESPILQTFTLGNFLDIWQQSSRSNFVDSSFLANLRKATVVHVFSNGKLWTKPYRDVPLTSHEVIYLEIGTPIVPPQPYTFAAGL